jgi:hypothetical protein
MDTTLAMGKDRVRESTPKKRNAEIDRQTEENIQLYSNLDEAQIRERIKQLDKEWDIERTLELNASLVALAGITLATTVNKKWWILPAVVTTFLAQHAIQGWCPPLPLFRSMNIRTRKEIDREKYALIEVLEKRKMK